MHPAHVRGHGRANFVCFAAQRDHCVRLAPRHVAEALRVLPGDVDPGLEHHLDRGGMDAPGLGPRAPDLGASRRQSPGEALGHLAASGVVDAHEDDAPGWRGNERSRALGFGHAA